MWAMQCTPFVFVLLLLASWCVAAPAAAQHVELGGFATFIDMDNVDQAPWGGGGRFGVEVLPFATLEAEVGVFPAIKSYVIVVLGGMGSVVGSVVAALILGVFEAFGAVYLSYGYRDTFGLVILIVVLLFRPQGLFGEKGREV